MSLSIEPLPHLVAEVERCLVNETGNCRKRKDRLMFKAIEYNLGELNSNLASAKKRFYVV